MVRLLVPFAAAILVAWPLSAQTPPSKRKPSAPASIEGDVYLLNKGGEVKKGAAGTVGLAVPESKLETVFRATCAAQHGEELRDAALTGDPAAEMARIIGMENRHREEMFATLVAASAKAPTGMNAHFSFAKVPPGPYFLLSVMHLGERLYGWVVPITLKSGESLRLDLDNKNAQLITASLSIETGEAPEPDHNPLFCGRDGMGRQFPLR